MYWTKMKQMGLDIYGLTTKGNSRRRAIDTCNKNHAKSSYMTQTKHDSRDEWREKIDFFRVFLIGDKTKDELLILCIWINIDK